MWWQVIIYCRYSQIWQECCKFFNAHFSDHILPLCTPYPPPPANSPTTESPDCNIWLGSALPPTTFRQQPLSPPATLMCASIQFLSTIYQSCNFACSTNIAFCLMWYKWMNMMIWLLPSWWPIVGSFRCKSCKLVYFKSYLIAEDVGCTLEKLSLSRQNGKNIILRKDKENFDIWVKLMMY